MAVNVMMNDIEFVIKCIITENSSSCNSCYFYDITNDICTFPEESGCNLNTNEIYKIETRRNKNGISRRRNINGCEVRRAT